jgi:hypothetical protein
MENVEILKRDFDIRVIENAICELNEKLNERVRVLALAINTEKTLAGLI